MTEKQKGGADIAVPAPQKPNTCEVQFGRIPEEIKGCAHWVVWQYELREGSQKWTKVLRDAWGSELARSNEPTTWAPFERAHDHYQAFARTLRRPGGLDGVGFVFSADDPFCGVDLDKCRDPQTGAIEPWAQEIIDRLNSYTEISPSGKGVKILLKAAVPGLRRREGLVEMYDQLRYFTVTGNHLEGTPPTVEERQEQLTSLYANIFPAESNGHANGATVQIFRQPLAMSDQEIINRAERAANREKFQRLWAGNTSGYPSHSEADAALCSILAFWCGPDPERIDRLFRSSGLCREKWEQRADYRDDTLRKALNRTEFFDPDRPARDDEPVENGACETIRLPFANHHSGESAVLTTIQAYLSRFDEDFHPVRRQPGQKPCRNVILLRNKKDHHAHRWVAVRCGCWKCSYCSNNLRAAWSAHFDRMITSLPEDQPVYLWQGPADDWDKVRMRISRAKGNYFRVFTGDGQLLIVTTAAIRDARLSALPEAIGSLTTSLESVSDAKRPVSSSRPWKLPQEEADKTGEWKRVGHRTGASGGQIRAETLEAGGQQVRTIPRPNNLRVEKFVDFRFPTSWTMDEIETACLRLLRKLTPLSKQYPLTG